MKRTLCLFLIGTLLVPCSCKKWLDVKPKTEVASDDVFSDEQGFKDALTGIYINMTQQAAYGRELSYGMMEVLAHNYTGISNDNNNDYYQDARFNYLFANTRKRVDDIWKTNYNTIANINNLIVNLEKADKNLFEGSNYAVIRGEAYGLRAFNHFDLLRLYAPSFAVGGAGAKAIPYRSKLSTEQVVSSTGTETVNKILADLEVASDMLRTTDPLVPANHLSVAAGDYLRNRQYRFNYFAVRALMARVYLYAGNKTQALACAKEVIDANAFPALSVGNITSGDRIFSTEVIFNLNINTLLDYWNQDFSTQFPHGFYLSDEEWNEIYELNNGGSADYRYLYQTEMQRDISTRLCIKLRPATNTAAPDRLVLMRVSEMYYIAAECLAATDGPGAVGYLNQVRTRRNLQPFDPSLSANEIQSQLFREYQKEFICEGQLFFYYKRLNLDKIQFTQTPATNAVYVLPKPDDEIEYGH